MKYAFAATLAASMSLAPAGAATLTTGAGDGGVTIQVDATGSMSPATGDYDPVGPGGPATTIWSSDLFYRVGDTGERSVVRTANVLSDGMNGANYVSQLDLGGALTATVTQSVAGLFAADGVTRTGSILQQVYDFSNGGASSLVLDLVRYIDGDLFFDGDRADGGGVRTIGGRQVLFETDSATDANDLATFVGLYNQGGTLGGFKIGEYGSLYASLAAGAALDNGIAGDTNGDGFIDSRYDVGLAQQSSLAIAAQGRGRFTTVTLFGTGIPGELQVPGAVPEPATWAMMIGGFGLVGGAMRRRRRSLVTA